MGASTSNEQRSADELPSTVVVGTERAVQLLADGDLRLLGPISSSSNYIFLCSVDDGDLRTLAIYKPLRGESPLWDFPRGTLGLREVAAFLLSQVLGWPLIPPTVLRSGPHGPGAVQLYIDADPTAHYFTFPDARLAELRPVALFDLVANNADRKGGHLLLDREGRIWAIDNALTFHEEPKLRTVIWDFAGDPIPETDLADLLALRRHLTDESGALRRTLSQLLSATEITALDERLKRLLSDRVFPMPDSARRQVPWPLV